MLKNNSTSTKTSLNNKLTEEYTKLGSPGAYMGFNSFKRSLDNSLRNKLSDEQIKTFLQTRDEYTTHRPLRHSFPTQKIWVGGVNQLHQGDLMDMSRVSTKNDGVHFLLAVIDCFSRFAFVQPLKNKSSSSMLNAMHNIYDTRDKPLEFMSDSGMEFKSKNMQKYFSENEIVFLVSYGNTKSAFVERFIETFKRILWRYMTDKATYRYIDELQSMVLTYNNSYHRSIGMAPSRVSQQNVKNVFTHMYGDPTSVFESSKNTHPSYKFKVGDNVRISVKKGVFEKGYVQTYSSEIYEVSQILKHLQPVQYRLTTLNGEEVKGKFYPQELVAVTYDPDKIYPIEKIVAKEKRKDGKTYVKVKWLGWDKSYNSWIPQEQMVEREGPTF